MFYWMFLTSTHFNSNRRCAAVIPWVHLLRGCTIDIEGEFWCITGLLPVEFRLEVGRTSVFFSLQPATSGVIDHFSPSVTMNMNYKEGQLISQKLVILFE